MGIASKINDCVKILGKVKKQTKTNGM